MQMVAGIVILAGVVIGLAPRKHVTRTETPSPRHRVLAVLAAIGQGGGAVLSRKAFFVSRASGPDN